MNIFYKKRYMTIEHFHSRGQLTCKFIETKESVYMGKELVHQHGRRFHCFGTHMAAVTSCENVPSCCYLCFKTSLAVQPFIWK